MPTTANNITELRRLLHERKAREQRTRQDNLPDPFGACNEGKYDANNRPDVDIGVPMYGTASKGISEFQDHIANPDLEALTEAAERTDNSELVDHVLDERAGKATEEFVK